MADCTEICRAPMQVSLRSSGALDQRSNMAISAKDEIINNKTQLEEILSANINCILNKVLENRLTTFQEYLDFKEKKDINSLIDGIICKGKDTCKCFLNLLRTDRHIQGIFPDLKTIRWEDPLKRGLDDPKDVNDGPVQSKRHKGGVQGNDQSNDPISCCVNNINIIQRENFGPVHSDNTANNMPPHDDGDDMVTGFIHCVTPIKMSMKMTRVKYFTALLQTGPDQFRRTVIFDPEKLTPFTQAQNTSTAVKLICVGFSDDDDVMVYDRSTMVKTIVPFEPQQPPYSEKLEIVDVLKLKPKTKFGKLEAHVISKGPIKIVNNRGERCEVKECLICDSSGQIQLQLWGDLINDVKINTSYEFSNIATRHKPDETQLYLTCTKETTITTIDNLAVPEHMMVQSVDEYPITILGEISAIDLLDKPRCGHCGKSQIVTQSEYHQCQHCKLNQPIDSFTSNVFGTIVMTTKTEKVYLDVSPSPLTAYLTSCNLLHLLKDTRELVSHFLKYKHFKVCHSAKCVVDSLEKEQP